MACSVWRFLVTQIWNYFAPDFLTGIAGYVYHLYRRHNKTGPYSTLIIKSFKPSYAACYNSEQFCLTIVKFVCQWDMCNVHLYLKNEICLPIYFLLIYCSRKYLTAISVFRILYDICVCMYVCVKPQIIFNNVHAEFEIISNPNFIYLFRINANKKFALN